MECDGLHWGFSMFIQIKLKTAETREGTTNQIYFLSVEQLYEMLATIYIKRCYMGEISLFPFA